MIAEDRIVQTELAGGRLAAYRFLHAALDFPATDRQVWLASAGFRKGLELLCDRFEVPCPEGALFPEAPADVRSLYLACFEVGLPRPPVPLLASHYNHREPVPATIHEHALFYKKFGARVADGNPEPPDHIRNELAFLIYLDELLLSGTIEAASILRARLDFLTRQVHPWVRRAAEEARSQGLSATYECLLALLACAVAEDLAWCRAASEAMSEKIEP